MKNFEFCKAMNCEHFYPTNRFEKANCAMVADYHCIYTAKELLHWLEKNLYEIRKVKI